MRRALLLAFASIFMLSSWAMAQRTVKGVVTDAADGSTLPGVNVVIKGTASGTVTDIDGNYSLQASDDAVLVFSYVGYTAQEITVGSQSQIDVALILDSQELEELVVTALGTKQNAQSVTYANQSVKAEELLTTPSKNALEALRGKTAGVKITSSSGSVGASNRIVLRGEASLTGNNNALIVIDGVPIDNTSNVGGAQGGEAGYADFGNRFNDFDPNNIESIDILKGPSATSLYGSRGASGVLLITTKSGSKGMKINFNSTSSVERAYVLNQRQTRWGQGILNPDGSTTRESGENWSWGPEFDGVLRPWSSPIDTDGDGTLDAFLSRPYVAVDNQLQNFFRTGSTFKNNLSVSGGNDKYKYFASYGNTTQKGILDNTDYSRQNFTFNSSAKFNDKVSSSMNLTYSYVDQNTAQEGSRAFEGQNAYAAALQAPNTIPYTELRDYNSPFHNLGGYYGSYTTNPYFILNEFTNNAKINNFLASGSITYKPIKNLTLQTRGGINAVNTDRTVAVPQYAYEDHYSWGDNLSLAYFPGRQSSGGSVQERNDNTRVIDWTSTATYDWKLNDDFNLSTVVGFNYYDVHRTSLIGATNGGLVIPGVYNLNNSRDQATVTPNHFGSRILGLFANFALDWRSKLFVNYSARNDWSSTLPPGNQAFDYHALGVSAIMTEIMDLSNTPIEYLKLRGSIGTTGKDASAYLLNSTYNINPTFRDFGDIYQINAPFNGQTGISRGGLIGNPNLKPELTTSVEFGADFDLFKGRVSGAYTYYHNTHSDQIVQVQLSRASAYTSTALNVGEIINKGHELTLGVVPVLVSGFKWKLDFTWSRNINEVVKISDQVDELTIYNSGRGALLTAREGQPYGTWKAPVATYAPDGRQIVTSSGVPAYTTDEEVVGSVQPKWIGGLVNTFSYKGLTLTAVFDARQGGQILSLTRSATAFNGTSIASTFNDRKNYVIPNSVVANVDAETGETTYTENTSAVTVFNLINDGNNGRDLIDGSFLKFRELSLGYNIPKKVLKNVKLQAASVNFFVKNVRFWLPSENTYADPEVNGPSGASNITGVETSQTPPSRSYGINLNITF